MRAREGKREREKEKERMVKDYMVAHLGLYAVIILSFVPIVK